jgi:hypothetical protein
MSRCPIGLFQSDFTLWMSRAVGLPSIGCPHFHSVGKEWHMFLCTDCYLHIFQFGIACKVPGSVLYLFHLLCDHPLIHMTLRGYYIFYMACPQNKFSYFLIDCATHKISLVAIFIVILTVIQLVIWQILSTDVLGVNLTNATLCVHFTSLWNRVPATFTYNNNYCFL